MMEERKIWKRYLIPSRLIQKLNMKDEIFNLIIMIMLNYMNMKYILFNS